MTIREAFGKLAAATAKGMKNPFFVIRNLHKEFKDIQENVTSCGLIQDAKDIDYDNTSSGLTAEDAQAAIDELADEKVNKAGDTMTGRLNIFYSDEVQFIAARQHDSTTSRPSSVAIGNNIPSGTPGSAYGRLILYGTGNEYTRIEPSNTTQRQVISLPDESGTLAIKENLLTDTFTSVGAGSTLQAIYQLHGSLADNQKCACLLNYGSTELFVIGYRANSERGRYIAVGRTGEDVLAFRIYGKIVSQNVITGTITTETMS